jgi:hypothetical protein
MEHHLKTWPNAFAAVVAGTKRFEWRKDDRGFEVGDVLVLKEYDPHRRDYVYHYADLVSPVPNSIRVRVTYIARGVHEIPNGYCIMSIVPEDADASA